MPPAVRLAEQLSYRGAGTVEFLVDAETRRILFPGDERAHPGRASGDRGDHRHRSRRAADRDRRGRALAAHAERRLVHRPRHRSAASMPKTRARFPPRARHGAPAPSCPPGRGIRVDTPYRGGRARAAFLRFVCSPRSSRTAPTAPKRSRACRRRSPRLRIEGVEHQHRASSRAADDPRFRDRRRRQPLISRPFSSRLQTGGTGMTDIKPCRRLHPRRQPEPVGRHRTDTAQISRIAPVMDRVGFHAIDFISSTHHGGRGALSTTRIPWERIRRMRAAMPRTPLQFITTGMRFIAWEPAGPDFMRLVYRRLQAQRHPPLHHARSDARPDGAASHAAKVMKEEGARRGHGARSPSRSATCMTTRSTPISRARRAASPAYRPALHQGPGGLLSPERARTLMPGGEGGDRRQALGNPRALHDRAFGARLAWSPRSSGHRRRAYRRSGRLAQRQLAAGSGRAWSPTCARWGTRSTSTTRRSRRCRTISRLAEAEGLPLGTPQEFDAASCAIRSPAA